MSAGSLRERVAEVIREHAPDEGDCICSEYVLDVPHAAHLADAVLAEVRAWLAEQRGAGGRMTNRAPMTCHCLVIDGRWRRQAEHCPQHVDGETWRDA